MAVIEWKDGYSVGITAIDIQHKQLFSLINQLYQAMQHSKVEDAMKTILPSLLSYTKTHFSAEEKMLSDAGYPQLKEHLGYHRQFTLKVTDIIEKYNTSGIAPSATLASFLKDWLSNHILVKDKQYGAFLAEQKMAAAR